MKIHYKKFLSQSQKEETFSHKSNETNTSKNIKKISSSGNKSENSKSQVIDPKEKFLKALKKINPRNSKMITLERYVFLKFNDFYSNKEDFYNIKVINEIICNESTHVVAAFKDYLINEDTSEFLQKFYTRKESKEALPKIFEYYDCCSVIFPNYVVLPESKYIYKNIQRKQRVIDNQQDLEDKQELIKNGIIKIKDDDNPVFNTVELDSILDQTNTSGIKRFFGIKNRNESNFESKNISIEDIIKKISTVENFFQEIKNKKPKKNINLIAINSNKGRNYNRNTDSGYINNISNSKKNMNNIGINSISSISKNTKVSSTTIEIEPKNQNNVFYNSINNNLIKQYNNLGSKKHYLINNLLTNNNKNTITKTLEEEYKNKSNNQLNTITTSTSHKKKLKNLNNILPITKKIHNKNKFNKILSSVNHIKTLSSSSSSPEQRLITFHHTKNILSTSKLQSINQKNIFDVQVQSKENLIRNLNFREYIPFTSRESNNFNFENVDILNPKLKRLNKKISFLIPNKKNKSYNNINKQKELQTINNEFNSLKQINHKKRKFNFKENFLIPLNSKLIPKKKRDQLSKSPYLFPKRKFSEIYSNFHSDGSLIGNNYDKKKLKNIKNSAFPKKEKNLKGLQIKGFKELIHNCHNYNSRNSKDFISERILLRGNSVSKTNFSNKTFMEIFATTHRKK